MQSIEKSLMMIAAMSGNTIIGNTLFKIATNSVEKECLLLY